MIETHGRLAEARLEKANEQDEQTRASHAYDRYGEFQVTCSVIDGCGRIEGPGEEFEDESGGFICPSCIERRMADELAEPGLLISQLFDCWDNAGGTQRAILKPAIEQAAVLDGYWGRMPWQTAEEFEVQKYGPFEDRPLTDEELAAADEVIGRV